MDKGKPYDKKKSCKDCPDRTVEPNCHMTCEFHLERVAKTEKIRIAKEMESYASKFGSKGYKARKVKR